MNNKSLCFGILLTASGINAGCGLFDSSAAKAPILPNLDQNHEYNKSDKPALTESSIAEYRKAQEAFDALVVKRTAIEAKISLEFGRLQKCYIRNDTTLSEKAKDEPDRVNNALQDGCASTFFAAVRVIQEENESGLLRYERENGKTFNASVARIALNIPDKDTTKPETLVNKENTPTSESLGT